MHLHVMREAIHNHVKQFGRSTWLHNVHTLPAQELKARIHPPRVPLNALLLGPACELQGSDGDDAAGDGMAGHVLPLRLVRGWDSLQLNTTTNIWRAFRAGATVAWWERGRNCTLRRVPGVTNVCWDKWAAAVRASWKMPTDDVWTRLAVSGLATQLDMRLLARVNGICTHQRLHLNALQTRVDEHVAHTIRHGWQFVPDMSAPLWQVVLQLRLELIDTEVPVIYPFGLLRGPDGWYFYETRIDFVARKTGLDGLVVGEYKTIVGSRQHIAARAASKRDMQQVVLNAFLLACCARVHVSHALLLYTTRAGDVTEVWLPLHGSDFVRAVINEFIAGLQPLYVDARYLLNEPRAMQSSELDLQVLTDVVEPFLGEARPREPGTFRLLRRVSPYSWGLYVDMLVQSNRSTDCHPWKPAPRSGPMTVYRWREPVGLASASAGLPPLHF